MNLPPVSMSDIGIIVLAAGSSRRFGTDKRLAKFDQQTSLLEKTLSTIPDTFTRKILVVKKDDAGLAEQFSKTWEICLAEAPESGMANSLASAIAQAESWEGAIIALGDMPFIASQTYIQIQQTLTENNIVIPVHKGQRGNPVGFRRKYFTEIGNLQGDKGARPVLEKYRSQCVELETADSGILKDIDRPDMLT